ncbi:MAG: hypothetical protein M1840_006749 [Geoglossum simile]|nr:MAG: hypothetical protein M1840_006749 [Geoglossum simile]
MASQQELLQEGSISWDIARVPTERAPIEADPPSGLKHDILLWYSDPGDGKSGTNRVQAFETLDGDATVEVWQKLQMQRDDNCTMLIRCDENCPQDVLPLRSDQLSEIFNWNYDLSRIGRGSASPGFLIQDLGRFTACRLTFPSLYRGHVTVSILFRSGNQSSPMADSDPISGILVGIQKDQLKVVFANALSLGRRTCPTLLISIVMMLSSEDSRDTQEKVNELKKLEGRISSEPTSKLGEISIQLNVLRSTLPILQTGAAFLESLATEIETWGVDRRYISTCAQVAQSCKHRQLEVQCLQQRIDINMTVINNLATQDHVKWTKRVAQATKRDSSAMKVIAVLGLLFLPGTFISTFFAMPLFNWDNWTNSPGSRSSPIRPGFWVYWAAAIPTTVSLILCVGIWLYIRSQNDKYWDDEEKRSL